MSLTVIEALFKKSMMKIAGKYLVLSELGRGAFSSVYKAENMVTGKTVALKFINRSGFKDLTTLRGIERELRITDQLSHPNIISTHEKIFTDDQIILVMDFLKKGTLADLKAQTNIRYPERKYMEWGKEILEGLRYLHERGVSHHDIKPDNIGFSDEMNVKIIDFGLCEDNTFSTNIKHCNRLCGTPFYIAPEILKGDPYDGEKSDIWSFGVTFHYMMTGELPFQRMSLKKFLGLKDIASKIDIKCGGNAKKIVEMALQVDPKKRPTAKQLIESGLFKDPRIPLSNNYVALKNARSLTKKQLPRPLLIEPKLNKTNLIRKNNYHPSTSRL